MILSAWTRKKQAPACTGARFLRFRGVKKRVKNGSQNSFQRQPGSQSASGASWARFFGVLFASLFRLKNRPLFGRGPAPILTPKWSQNLSKIDKFLKKSPPGAKKSYFPHWSRWFIDFYIFLSISVNVDTSSRLGKRV